MPKPMPKVFESDAIASAVRRHLRRRRTADSGNEARRLLSSWQHNRRSPQTVWHLASVHELGYAHFLLHHFGRKADARVALAQARTLRRQACGSPIPGASRMIYGD